MKFPLAHVSAGMITSLLLLLHKRFITHSTLYLALQEAKQGRLGFRQWSMRDGICSLLLRPGNVLPLGCF